MDVLNKIQTQLKAPKSQYNKFGKYNYRSCEDILEAVKPHLAENGATLTLSDEVVQTGERYYIKTTVTLSWEGNERFAIGYAREPETKKGMDESQITGAASSYARKYALNGLFCIDDTKDADATNTHGHEPKHAPKKEPKQTPKQQTEAYNRICDVIDGATTLDELKTAWQSVQAGLQRLTKEQAGLATQVKDAKKKALSK